MSDLTLSTAKVGRSSKVFIDWLFTAPFRLPPCPVPP